MVENQDLFHIMTTTRPMRMLKSDPVSQALLDEILQAATCAPNSLNTQPYRFLVVRDRETKKLFGKRYDSTMKKRFAPIIPAEDDTSKNARNIRTAMKMGPRLKDCPVLLFVLGVRDWPYAVPEMERVGAAPPSFGSVLPCVQNILLGCRARGLGASLTTMHQNFEAEMCDHLEIPDTHGIVAVIPIGWPEGNFGPLTRRPISEITDFDRWGNDALPA